MKKEQEGAARRAPKGAAEIRAIAVAASVDPRTVCAYLAKKTVRQMIRARIEEALLLLGYHAVVRREG